MERQHVDIKDLIRENSVVATASGDNGEHNHLMKVTLRGPEELDIPTQNNWRAQ